MEDLQWSAKWIWDKAYLGEAEGGHQLVYFRRSFIAPADGESRLVVHVSADSRYRLYLNGHSVSVGPSKGDHNTHYYETVDLTGLIQPGINVLAAKVMHYPHSQPFVKAGPAAVYRTDTGVFLLEGQLEDAAGNLLESLGTDIQWMCLRDRALTFEKETLTLFIGGPEVVDGALVPHGWEHTEYDDRTWTPAVAVSDILDRRYGQLKPWQLERRTIPQLYEIEKGFQRVMRKEEAAQKLADELILSMCTGRSDSDNQGAIPVAAGEELVLELDAGELSTGYLRVVLSGGAGSKVTLLCSECYELDREGPGSTRKGVRDDPSGKILRGYKDTYVAGGTGQNQQSIEIYEPFWFRTFRFVRLHVQAGAEPLVLHKLTYRDTGYPLDIQGEFNSSDSTLAPLWRISINTLLRCMHETYEDCPYYEQMQYTMDTRLQMLFTYNISSDDRLARKAIYEFHSSMLPSGMLQSRYPSVHPQVIPGFALYWIFMVHDHYMYFGDESLVKRYRPTIDAVLDWFDRQISEDGLVGKMPIGYWSFVDWVKEWKVNAGAPVGFEQGPITIYSLMYAYALQMAAQLNEWTGRLDTAREYEARAERVNAAVCRCCWSNERMLFTDVPGVEEYSQHAQIWAVLAGALKGEDAAALLEQALTDTALYQVSYAMSFFLFRALSETGMYDRAFGYWDIWRKLAALNLTTWVEDPVSQRSDCHAWGAVPLSEFPSEILGVKPRLPGYAVIQVAPQLGDLDWAQGAVPTLHGPVEVSWRVAGEEFFISVQGPGGVPLELHLPDGTVKRYEDVSALQISAHCLIPKGEHLRVFD